MRVLAGVLMVAAVALGDRVSAAAEVERWVTRSGAPAYFISARTLPMVDVRLAFDAGSARDGESPGLAQIASTLIGSGSDGLDEDEVLAGFDAVGARFGTSASREMAMVSLRSLSAPEFLEPALEILEQLLARPAFPDTAFERERRRMLQALQSASQSPSAVGQRAFFEAVYGDHPYGSPPEGTESSLAALSVDTVRAFHGAHYVSGNVIVSIVGDLDRAAARALADRLTSALASGPAPPPLPEPHPARPGAVVRIPFPSTQAHMFIGDVGVSRGAPDYYALLLGNHVLGGSGLVSRLSSEVRDRRGLAYSVYSHFSPMMQAGPFVLNLQTGVDRVDEALEVVTATLGEFIANGPGEDELDAARQSVLGGFPLRFDSNAKLVEMLAAVGFYGLPPDFLEYYPAQVRQVTREEVIDAFGRRLDLDRMVTVIVGGNP